MDRRKFLKSIPCIMAGSILLHEASFGQNLNPNPGKIILPDKKSRLDYIELFGTDLHTMLLRGFTAMGGIEAFVKKGETVLIKPNVSFNRSPEQAATTNPKIVGILIKMCYVAGAKKVIVTDNTVNNALKVFQRSGIEEAVKKENGLVYYPGVFDFKSTEINGKTLKKWEILKYVLEADKIINVPIAKHHGSSQMSCCLKNWIGAAGGQRGLFHQDIHASITDLASFFKPVLNIVDATRVLMKNGPQGGSETDVAIKNTILMGYDQVALDAIAAGILNFKISDIQYLIDSEKRGYGTTDFKKLKSDRIQV